MSTTKSASLVLVHGTFAPNAEWTHPDSYLCTALRIRYPSAEFFPFNWSGRNSHSARIAAGKQLGEFVRNLKAERPDRPCYVIAHSHGGNVVLYALSQPSVETCVDGCVFLATPFISTRCRDFNLFLNIEVFQLTWLVPLILLMVTFSVLGLDLWMSLGLSLGVLLMSLFSLSMPAGPPFAGFPIPLRAINNRMHRFLLKRLSALQEDFRRYVTPVALNRPSLVCYIKRDEAKAWLGVVNFLSDSPFVATEYMLQFLQTWPLFFVVAGVAWIIDWFVGERSAFALMGAALSLEPAFLAGLFALFVMTFVLPVTSIVMRAHRAGFGWEGLFGYCLVDLVTTVYPAHSTGVVVKAIEAQPERRLAKGLRHSSLYLDANIVKAIGDWFELPSGVATSRALDVPFDVPSTLPAAAEIRRSDRNTVFFRCILFILAITLLGICWSAWERFHHVRDIPSELANGHVLHHEVLIRAQKYVLGPEEKKVWALPLRRPPDGQTSYITGHYKSNSVEGHLFLALGPEIHAPAGPPASWGNFEWEYWSHVCDIAKDPYLGSRKLVYSGGLGPRELSFGKKLEFGDDRMACFGVSIENQGKKTQAEFDVEIWLEYLVQ